MSIYDMNAALRQPNMFAALQDGIQSGQQQREIKETRADNALLRGLAPQVIAGDAEALDQAAAINSTKAAEYQKFGDARLQKLKNMYDYIEPIRAKARASGDPRDMQRLNATWREARPFVEREVGKQLPENWDDSFDDGWAGFGVRVAGAGGDAADNTPAAIRELQLLQSNPELYKMDIARRQAGWQPKTLNTADGMAVFTPQTGEAAPLNYGGEAPAAQGVMGGQGGFGIKETNDYVRNILGNAGQLDLSASPEQLAEQLLPHLIKQESGGNPNAVSPKGARGLTQVMPATGKDPGFGVPPLRDDSPEENVRFGRDYLTAMLKRYPGRPDLALAAYNAGPGVADRFNNPQASASGRVMAPSKQPSEIEQERLRLAQDANRRAEEAAARAARQEQRSISNPGAGKAPTEGERKAATLLKRMDGSLSQLEAAVKADPSAASPSVVASIAGSLPLVGDVARNAVSSSGRQQVEAAQLDILDAALTLGTGAAYTREQIEGYRKAYVPQIGDTEGTISAKKTRLENVLQAARIAAGRAAPEGGGAQGGGGAQSRTQAPASASDDDEALIGKYL
jgi:hypothetical protein